MGVGERYLVGGGRVKKNVAVDVGVPVGGSRVFVGVAVLVGVAVAVGRNVVVCVAAAA